MKTSYVQSRAEKRNSFAKQQPGMVGCGWLQPGRNFLSTYLEQIYTSLYRDALKGGPVLLSNSQAEPDRNFSQPRAHLLVNLCTICLGKGMEGLRVPASAPEARARVRATLPFSTELEVFVDKTVRGLARRQTERGNTRCGATKCARFHAPFYP